MARIVFVVAAAIAPARASAQDAADPGFVTLDRLDTSSRAGSELSYQLAFGANGPGWRAEAHAQGVLAIGLGAYAMVPMYYDADSSQPRGFGDVELGAVYAPRLDEHVALVARFGVVFDFTDSTDARTAFPKASRVGDYSLANGGTTMRLSLSPLVHWGEIFARADLGIDFDPDRAPIIARANGGVGFAVGGYATMIELVNLKALDRDGEFFDPDRWIHELAISARGRIGRWQPYAAVVTTTTKDDPAVAFTIGCDVTLR